MKYMDKHPLWMIVIGTLGISVSSIIVRGSEAPSAVTALYRLLWTVLLMSPVMWGKKEERQALLHADARTLVMSALSGILLAVHFATWFESLSRTSVAASTVIVSCEVLFVTAGARIFMREKLSHAARIAIATAFVGSVLIALGDGKGQGDLSGDILALIAAAAVGGYTLLGKVVRAHTGTGVYTYTVYVFCALTLAAYTLVTGTAWFGYGIRSVLCGLMLAAFSTLLGHSVFSWCLKYFSPAFVSAVKLTEPVIAGILAYFLFGEKPGAWTLIGGALILAGVAAYSVREAAKTKSEE